VTPAGGRGLLAPLLVGLAILTACRQQPSAAVSGQQWRMLLAVSPAPPKALRPAVLRLTVSGVRESDAATVTAEAAMPEMDHRAVLLTFTPVGDGRYEARHTFSMSGTWAVRVTVTGGPKVLTGSVTVTVAD
jgi:hypothetical protein